MATTIKTKHSTTAGNAPSSLAQGELAINVADGNLFYGDGSAVKQDFAVNQITASGDISVTGDISASGTIKGNFYKVKGKTFASFTEATNTLALGGDSLLDKVVLGKGNSTVLQVFLPGQVTASGNISASGTIVGSNLSGTNTGDQDLSSYALIANISGAFAADSASFSSRITTIEGAGYTTNTGTVDTSGTPADNQIAVFTDSDTIEGTSKLTFSNNDLLVHSANVDNSGIEIFGGSVGTIAPHISPVGALTSMRFGDGTSGHTFDFQNNKIAFDQDSTNTYIQADTDDPENLEIHADNNIELNADNLVTMTTASIEHRLFDTGSSILANDGGAIGDIVKFGGTSTTAGKVYYLKTDGTWGEAQANAVGTATSSLAVALGSNSTTNGMCLRGLVHPSNDPVTAGIGHPVYLSDTHAGRMSATAPDSTNDVVRIVGYRYGTDLIYFNPSPDFIVHA